MYLWDALRDLLHNCFLAPATHENTKMLTQTLNMLTSVIKNIFLYNTNKHFNTSHPDPRWRKKINLIFFFHTSLWCLKRFHKGLKDLQNLFRHHKEVLKWKLELIFTLLQLPEMYGARRTNMRLQYQLYELQGR